MSRDHRYRIDRAATGVERALNCKIINKLPEIRIVNDCPRGKHGYYVLGTREICIDRQAVDSGNYFVDLAICHELLHWLGVEDEYTADLLDGRCVAYMPQFQRK